MTDLTTNKTKRLTKNHASSEPVTNGRFVAWKQGPKGGTRFEDGAIMLLNRRTGKVNAASLKMAGRNLPTCSSKPHRVENCEDQPIMSDRILAWVSIGGPEIMARDLQTGKEFVVYISNPPHVSTRPNNASGQRLVWTDTKIRKNENTQDLAIATVP